jgi:hypothetical protein
MGRIGLIVGILVWSFGLLAQSNSLAGPASKSAANADHQGSFEAILTKTLDARKCQTGDIVLARTAEDVRLKGDIQIPKNAKLIGHLSEVRVKGRGATESRIGVIFDKAQMRDGREVPIRLLVQSVAAEGEPADSNSVRTIRIEEKSSDDSESVFQSNSDNLRIESGAHLTLRLIQQ